MLQDSITKTNTTLLPHYINNKLQATCEGNPVVSGKLPVNFWYNTECLPGKRHNCYFRNINFLDCIPKKSDFKEILDFKAKQ